MVQVIVIKNGPNWLEIARRVDQSIPSAYREAMEWKFNTSEIYRKSYPRKERGTNRN